MSGNQPGGITLGILEDMGWTIPDLPQVYVNISATGNEDGSSARPFNSVIEGISSVGANGVVWISAGNYPETMIISRSMTLNNVGGVVTIGQ